mgnify:CR=1 FL=1
MDWARNSLSSLVAALLCAAPAHAMSEDSGSDGPGNVTKAQFSLVSDADLEAEAAAEEFAAPDYNHVDLPKMAAPIVEDGRLVAYAFVGARLRLKSGVDVWRVRERNHLVLDELVKASHSHPLPRDGRSGFDMDPVRDAWLAAAGQHLEHGWVEGVDLVGGDMRLLSN